VAVERDQAKVDELESRGLADAVVVPDGQSWAKQVDSVDGVIDTVATSETLREGFDALGRGGTLIALGHVPGSVLPVDPERLLLDELIVAGTRYATRAEIAQTMELVRLGRVQPIVGATLPLERLNDALAMAHEEKAFGRIILDVAS
jgi:D-arabinose 1-dehydrogenase-like Zn-dependent alcohol dehydrogenase